MTDCYILAGRQVVEASLLEWARWLEAAGEARIVGRTTVGPYEVSTVFLGLDHSFGSGPPVLWETMVFDADGGRSDHDMQRCAGGWADAEAMHARTVAAVRAALGMT